MANIMEMMELCRLCLVKEQVNIPIFEEQGDARQIFSKISACLPVKVSREDNLPKKICDGCLYKLELLYQFWNTTTNAEKQLLTWLNEAGLNINKKSLDGKSSVILKEEPNLDAETLSNDTQNYILQQQQLPYQHDDFNFSSEDQGASNTASNNSDDQPPVSKRPRRSATKKRIVDDSHDDEMDDGIDAAIAKTEEESGDDCEIDTAFDDGGDDQDEDQPGPSGVGKISTEAPYEEIIIETEHDTTVTSNFQCEVCSLLFTCRKDYLEHHMSQFGSTFTCCRCDESFRNSTELYQHYETHKLEDECDIDNRSVIAEEIIEDDVKSINFSENVKAVLNIPGGAGPNELLYILDDAENQCVNEVVIEEEEKREKPDYTIIQVDHGYIIPSVFKGQLESKRRYKKKESTSDSIYDDEDTEATNMLVHMEPSTSKIEYSPPKSKTQVASKRRHEVPDFSAANYQIIHPNEDIDMQHFKCLRCEQLFINKFVFFRHIEKGKCYINSCDICSATFNKNSDFYSHYVSEHTERAICNFCFRTFMYEKNVKEHMLRHLDQFRHRCEECNKGFYTVREYRNHYKNRHMGIRHKCEVCGRSFADEYYFKRHLATHGITVNQSLS